MFPAAPHCSWTSGSVRLAAPPHLLPGSVVLSSQLSTHIDTNEVILSISQRPGSQEDALVSNGAKSSSVWASDPTFAIRKGSRGSCKLTKKPQTRGCEV